MLNTYFLKVNGNIEKNDFDRLLSCVSEEKAKRILRFRRFEDAQRTLIGDILARYAICKRLGTRNRDLVFGANEYGKPILLEPYGSNFNISHSGNWVVCAVDESSVGIDVEMIKLIDYKIADRFFSRDEKISFRNQPEGMKLTYFYMIWTLKESYIKAEGKGLSIPLNSFTIRAGNKGINALVNNEIQKFHFCQSFLDCDNVYAVCTLNGNTNESVYLDIDSFLKEVQKYCFLL